MQRIPRQAPKIITAVSMATLAVSAAAATAFAAPVTTHAPSAPLTVKQVLSGASLSHKFVPVSSAAPKSEPLAGPDDLTALGGHLFTAFQNGVGSKGEPSTSGNRDSTIVEFTRRGKVLNQWDVRGKVDGLTADPAWHRLIATVNEDGTSSLYTVDPSLRAALQVRLYRYNKPLPSNGGTDAISIYRDLVLISASAPGSTGKPAPQPTYPAVYQVTFNNVTRVASVRALFFDESWARVANLAHYGRFVRLGLTDPDSNSVVPAVAHRFSGTFMLTSQGDKEQIFVVHPGSKLQRLWVLRLSQAVDDTAWATSRNGSLFVTDSKANAVDVVSGRFALGAAYTAVTPCDANGAPSTCPAPPTYLPNYLGVISAFSGHVYTVPVTGVTLQPKGMLFLRSAGASTAGKRRSCSSRP
jgi:hypothetical protein